MGEHHLKRLASPKTWHIKRKELKFITKPMPGPHSLDTCVPFNLLLKEILNYASTTKEVKKILNANSIKIDGKIRRNFKFPVGIFDTIEFANECLRVILNKKGKIDLVKISKEEALFKPCRIIGKKMVNEKLQLNLYDGKNIFVDNGAYKLGDTIVISLPEQKILKHLSLGKNSTIFLVGGKHIGEIGSVENIIGDKITYRDQKGELAETLKKYAFVIENNKSPITIGER